MHITIFDAATVPAEWVRGPLIYERRIRYAEFGQLRTQVC